MKNAANMLGFAVKKLSLPFITIFIAGCSPATNLCHQHNSANDIVYVVKQGWHTEIGIPVAELDDHLQFYRKVFSGARVIMFGYGKKTFFTSPPETISEYVIGPFPGTAVIHAVGLSVTPMDAYPHESTITLDLPAGGSRSLSQYIWNELSNDNSREPRVVARSENPDGLFYAVRSEYNLLHTCNSWIADALHAAGLPISGDGVIISSQVMARVNEISPGQCPTLR